MQTVPGTARALFEFEISAQRDHPRVALSAGRPDARLCSRRRCTKEGKDSLWRVTDPRHDDADSKRHHRALRRRPVRTTVVGGSRWPIHDRGESQAMANANRAEVEKV